MKIFKSNYIYAILFLLVFNFLAGAINYSYLTRKIVDLNNLEQIKASAKLFVLIKERKIFYFYIYLNGTEYTLYAKYLTGEQINNLLKILKNDQQITIQVFDKTIVGITTEQKIILKPSEYKNQEANVSSVMVLFPMFLQTFGIAALIFCIVKLIEDIDSHQ